MKVVIAGAGSVGRSVAKELTHAGHDITIVDKQPSAMKIASVPEADWILADACEPETLQRAQAGEADVVVAATGDDKANLVISLLSKTEYGVERVIARVNDPADEWLFDDSWGVDVAISTPRVMAPFVEDALSNGRLVTVMRFCPPTPRWSAWRSPTWCSPRRSFSTRSCATGCPSRRIPT